MTSARRLLVVIPLLIAATAFAQDAGKPADRDLNLRAYMELLRKDIKYQRTAIINEIMQFDTDEAATFWPIYRQYDAELTALGNNRLEIIDDYINNYETISDEKADALMNKAYTFEEQRAALKKKYFNVMKSTLSARRAAQFFQVENQMQYVLDLQIAAGLPTMSN